MSNLKDLEHDQDPDYATPGPSNEAHQKLYEETARSNVARKIEAIVEKEFSKEIETKEKEILQIEGRLHKALKTLHFLRYVIITDYYNRKQCQLPQATGETKQTRIHPAIKQVIGKSPKVTETVFNNQEHASGSKESEDTKIVSSLIETNNEEIEKRLGNIDETSNESINTKKNCRTKRNQDSNFTEPSSSEPPKKIPRYVPPNSGIPEPQVPSRGARHKVRKRIIVGNISKWIPPDWREDSASHKWTMYVRGSKENPDISEFVGKIRFFLHPSYRPNDVVEITSPPFHLSRRGWGEFPVRVQLHFKHFLNKPMDIIHYLKLDRTYTGLQTLGSETVVDVWIKVGTTLEDDVEKTDPKNFADFGATIKQEPQEAENDSENSTLQNSQYSEKIKIKEEFTSYVYREHDYANIPDENTLRLLKNENNVTISHSPPRNTTNNENILSSSWSNGENHREKNSTKLNGNCELKNNAIDPSRIHSRQDVKTMASSFDNSSSMLQPLKITIPPGLEALGTNKIMNKEKKQILVMRDNKLIPVNSMNHADNARPGTVISTVVTSSMRENPKAQRANVSLLKKSVTKPVTFTLNPSNSLLINSSNNIPALKIVEPSSQSSCQSHPLDKNDTKRPVVSLSKTKDKQEKSSEHWLENSKLVKPKITLGKDRIGTTSKKDKYEELLRTIDEVRIDDLSGLMHFIMKRLPLVTEKATDPEYRSLHPYASSSEKEFADSNIGKQRALEWYRAKHVKSFVKKKGIPEDLQWTVKEIMIWARLHGYTPILLSSLATRPQDTGKKSSDKNLPDNSLGTSSTCTEPSELLEFIRNSKESKSAMLENKTEEEIEIIDVETVANSKNEPKNTKNDNANKSQLVSLGVPEKIVPLQSYVCETSSQIGIKLEPEEIVPGVMHCAPARIMVRAVQCLVEDLLRGSLAKAWERSMDGGCPDTITLEDVRGTILNREEFDIFTNKGLGSHHYPKD